MYMYANGNSVVSVLLFLLSALIFETLFPVRYLTRSHFLPLLLLMNVNLCFCTCLPLGSMDKCRAKISEPSGRSRKIQETL